MFSRFPFFVFMLGLHRVYVSRMRGRGRKEKEASQSFCGFTHKRSQISLICMLSSSLWDNSYPSQKEMVGVPWSCELSPKPML